MNHKSFDPQFTISGANKTVKKTFYSIDEVKQHIKDNSLYPEKGNKAIFVVETITHSIETEVPTLSNDNKQRLLDHFRNGEYTWVMFNGGLLWAIYSEYSKEKWHKSTPWSKKLCKLFMDISGRTENDLIKRANDQKAYMDDKFHKDLTDATKEAIKMILKISTIKDFEYLKVSTNYKPCNSISMRHKHVHEYGLQIRPDDMVISNHEVVGRNVSAIKSSALIDADLSKKELKKINPKLNSIFNP